MSEPGEPLPQDQLFSEAAGWFARMRGPDSESSRAEFDRWLARGALHRAAYNRAAEVFALGKLLGDDDRRTDPHAGRSGRRSSTLVPAALASLLLAGAATWLALRPQGREDGVKPRQTAMMELATGSSEIRRVRLADGSIIRLEAGTRVTARFSDSARQVTLERGRALFQVAHQPRPFTVFAGGGSITARGTLFDVGLSPDHLVRVRLVEGIIDVKLPTIQARSDPPVRRLRRGQTISFREQASRTGPVASPSAAHLLPSDAAQTGEFDRIRLAELLSRANRRSARPIRLADTDLGERRVSGRFRIEDPELLAERIALLFDLVVDRSDPATLVLRQK